MGWQSLDGNDFMATSAEVQQMKADMAERAPGVRRLLEKRLEKTEKELTDQAADRLYPGTRSRVAAHCLEIAEYRKPSREAGLVPILTASCLVDASNTQALGAELTAIQEEEPAANIRFLGPWPPYSFADMSGNEDAMQGGQR